MPQQTSVLRTLDDCNREIKFLLKKSVDLIDPEFLISFHAMLLNENEKEKFQKDLNDLIVRWASYCHNRNIALLSNIIIVEDLTESEHNELGRP